MSKVISVLEKMASDAAMNGDSAIAELVATSDINDGQMQAIIEKNPEELAKITPELPKIGAFFPLIPAEDDEPEEEKEEENTESNSQLKTAVNG